MPTCPLSNFTNFYPRPPRGGRPSVNDLSNAVGQFLSTPSARRATMIKHRADSIQKLFLSTPSARRATGVIPDGHAGIKISIHALREEGDLERVTLQLISAIFLSTPSARRATGLNLRPSISFVDNFYPRPPRGGRHGRGASQPGTELFLSTPSARRATLMSMAKQDNYKFLSTPSARRATFVQLAAGPRLRGISIHALREEGDLMQLADAVMPATFLSTPSARRATAKTETKSLFSNKLYNILHEFRRALIYNWSKNYPNHAK